MLMPKRVKHRKVQRGRMKGKATRGNFLAYGDFGIHWRIRRGRLPHTLQRHRRQARAA